MAPTTGIEGDLPFGEWFHQQLHEVVTFEDAEWAVQRARRIEARLAADRPAEQRFRVEIPWIEEFTAYTCPGRYIYISRRLYERCADDEQAAFIVAHEIAHHDLGHLRLLDAWTSKITRLPGSELLAFVFHALARRLYGPESECDADRHGLDLCLQAGYDGSKCVGLFDVLENYALDVGDQDMVFGPDENSDDELDPKAPWLTKARIWTWQRTRGYLPIRDRRKALLNHLGARRVQCAHQ